ncbi:MAG TPA: hypothetical protein DCS85_03355 [Verrucomicrobiales bacterium]|jgi:hypothetical protein|nr:hypothetical protein [Verrucomicrobiales bacterium]
MSDREKKLIILVGILVFVVLNLGAYQVWYAPRKKEAVNDEEKFVIMKGEAMAAMDAQDFKRAEIEWLERNEQKQIKSPQKALADLEALANREAKRRGLTVKRVKPMTGIEGEKLEFSRARLEIEVSGREQVLFQWIDRLNSPSELRTATSLRINPKKDDDTQVDCAVVLEQWFVPEGRDEAESTT